MDFTLSEAQEELAGLARKILAERDVPWADLAAAGVLAAGLPASLDGAGLGLLEQCSVLIELGRAASDVPYLASIVVGAAVQAGVVERALELTAEHARTRVQFGRPIGSFQAVAQRLADAYIDVEAVRLTMWQAAWLLAAGEPGLAVEVAVATAKFWAADAGHRVAHTAVHVHGGLGIDVSYPVHRYFTAAKHHEFALGGATTQLRRIGLALAE